MKCKRDGPLLAGRGVHDRLLWSMDRAGIVGSGFMERRAGLTW